MLISKINGKAWHKLDLSRTIISELPDLKFSPWWLGWLEFFFLTILFIYKAYFKILYTWKQKPRTHILCVKQLRLCIIGFCNQVLFDLHYWWSEELCNQQHLFKLLELVTYWDPCKGLVIDWRFVHQGKEGYYNIKSNWVLG